MVLPPLVVRWPRCDGRLPDRAQIAVSWLIDPEGLSAGVAAARMSRPSHQPKRGASWPTPCAVRTAAWTVLVSSPPGPRTSCGSMSSSTSARPPRHGADTGDHDHGQGPGPHDLIDVGPSPA